MNTQTTKLRPDPNFKQLFCQSHNCLESEYEKMLLREVMPRRGLVFAKFVYKRKPAYRDLDYRILDYVGSLSSRAAIVAEANTIKSEYHGRDEQSLYRRLLGVRISGRRLAQLATMATIP